MSERRQRVVLDAPSNLGLRPPVPGREPGAARMAQALRDLGLMERLEAKDAGAVGRPAYSPGPDAATGFRNGPALGRFTCYLAERVGELVDGDGFPIVLGGDCSVVLGPALALRRRGRFGLVFIDAHDDFSPPRDFDRYHGQLTAAGLDLALATGHLSPDLADLDGAGPYVAPTDVTHIGLIHDEGDNADYRTELFLRSGIVSFPAYEVHARGASAVADDAYAHIRALDLDGYWVHVDVDVLDQTVMPAVDSPNPAGLMPEQLETILRRMVWAPGAVGVDFAIYDPDLDPDRTAGRLLVDLISGVFDPSRP
ncbi:MAG: arginase family protein [Nocardioidaceae bacterium]